MKHFLQVCYPAAAPIFQPTFFFFGLDPSWQRFFSPCINGEETSGEQNLWILTNTTEGEGFLIGLSLN